MSKIFFRYGSMNAGKSLQILSIAHNYEEQGKKVLLFKPSIDTRDNGVIRSRVGLEKECILVNENVSMFEIAKTERPDAIITDESQFFSKEQIEELTDIADVLEIPVMAYGIKNDFLNELFEGAKYLLIYADKIEELKTLCWHCNRKAIHNMRVVDGVPSFNGEQVQVGGNESYVPVCRACYRKAQKKRV
jgi:thymidine kinase